MGTDFGGARLLSGWIRLNGDASEGSLGPGAKDVRQIAPNAVLSESSKGRAYQNVLHHGGFKCPVGLGLLDSVDKNTTSRLHPGNQVAPMHAGRS